MDMLRNNSWAMAVAARSSSRCMYSGSLPPWIILEAADLRIQCDDGLAEGFMTLKVRPLDVFRIEDIGSPVVPEPYGAPGFLVEELEDLRSALRLKRQLQKSFGNRLQGQQLLVVAIDDVGLEVLRDIDKSNLLWKGDDRKIVLFRIFQDACGYFGKALHQFDAKAGDPAFHQLLDKSEDGIFPIAQADSGG